MFRCKNYTATALPNELFLPAERWQLLSSATRKQMALFFNRFGWNRGIILYDTPAFESSVGATGGYLLAVTLHSYMLSAGIDIFGWELISHQSHEETLRTQVGNEFASESFDLGGFACTRWYKST